MNYYDDYTMKIRKYSLINKASAIVTFGWIGVFIIYAFIFILNVLASAEGGGWSFDSALRISLVMIAVVSVYPASRGFFYYSFFNLRKISKECFNTELRFVAMQPYNSAKVLAIILGALDMIFVPTCCYIVALAIEYVMK